MTNNEVISQIRSRNKWLAEDTEISNRALYRTAQDCAAILIKQEFNKGRLLTSDTIFQALECEELEKVSATECNLPYSLDKPVRRTKNIYENIGESELGYSIMGVFNIINSQEIFPTTVREYTYLNSLRIKPKDNYYLMKKGHIYVLNEDIENINVYVYSTEDLSQGENSCVPFLEREFRLPTYLKESLYKMIDGTLINVHNFSVDRNDDNNEETSQSNRRGK